MHYTELLDVIGGAYSAVDGEEGWKIDLEDVVSEEIVDLWDARECARALQSACKEVQKELEDKLLAALGPAGAARLDDYVVRGAREVKRVCTDPEGLREFLGADAFDAFNPNQVRLTSLEEIAKKQELDPRYAVDTFFEERSDPNAKPKLATIPIDKPHAPKWAKAAEHGTVKDALR